MTNLLIQSMSIILAFLLGSVGAMVRYLRETTEGQVFKLKVFIIEVFIGGTLAAVSYDLTPEGPGRMLIVFFCGIFSREILAVTQKVLPRIVAKIIERKFWLEDIKVENIKKEETPVDDPVPQSKS